MPPEPFRRWSRRRFLAAAGAGLAAMSAPWSASAFDLDRDTPFGARLIILNEPVEPPNLPLLRADGETTRMSAYPGDVVVAVFWATWCHVCHKEMPEIDAMLADLGDEGVRVLPMSLDAGDDAIAKVAAYYDRRDIARLEPLIDADRLSANALGVRGTPTTFILNKEAKIVSAIEGQAFFNSDEAKRYLRHLAAA